jgi:tetratricopeptide (TPR) repeat protein
MKSKYVILASAVLISVSAFAQKDELKTLKKLYAKEQPSDNDLAVYKATVLKAEPLVVNSDESDKVYLNFYKVMAPVLDLNSVMSKPENQNNPQLVLKYLNVQNVNLLVSGLNGVLDFEKKSGKQVYTKNIEETIVSFKPTLVNYAVALGNQSQFKDAALVLHSIYELDKKDAEKLYYAANYGINAKDYDLALQYYQELKNINYSGEGLALYATNKESKKEESFATKQEREIYLKGGTHEKPRDEKIPSKRGEIYKNIALILVEKGKIDEAKWAIQEARKENPDDTSLMLSEADLYYNLNDLVAYKKIITEVLDKNPNDADLIFNLGVISLKSNQSADAEKYFVRAIEINPKYTNAYLNLADLKLQSDKKIVTEMNSLGNSVKDNKRYVVLKAEREKVFKSALPFLEKALELDPKNGVVVDNLLSVYNFLEMTDKYKALKATKK